MSELDTLRHHIDEIDDSILDLLEIRMKVTDEIGKFKKANAVSIMQKDREHHLKERLKNKSTHPILKEKIASIFQLIMETSKLSMSIQNAPECPFDHVGILGFGIMGGSIAKALKVKKTNIKISTLKRDSADIKSALDSKTIDVVYDSIADLAQNNDLIVVATPIDTVDNICKKIHSTISKKKLIVIDIASVKEEITKRFQEYTNDTIEFLPTHPMAGSEHSGFTDSTAGLFINRPWIICPHTKTNERTQNQVTEFIKSLGSNPIIMNAKQHDESVAKVSHLVFLISTYLFAYSQNDPEAMKLAGTGFESITRLASGNASMHAQIFEKNSKNIETELEKFIDYMLHNKLTTQSAASFFEKNKMLRDEFIKKTTK